LGYNGKLLPYDVRAIHHGPLVDESRSTTGTTEGNTAATEHCMDTTYRFRFLIYLAAFMLAMSLCFVYAEPLPSQNHLLFQTAPQHAGFLAPLAQEPTFDPAALSAAAPVISPRLLQQLHAHHRFFHRAKHALVRPVAANGQNESSALGLTIASPSTAPSAR
jgi:hypothetical protein